MNDYLSKVRVLDLTQLMAGSLCGMFLGDLGADVVKVEPPEGEVSRTLGDTTLGGESDFFLSMNRNKRSVVLDLKSTQGAACLAALAAQSDVLVENFRPGVATRLGIDYETLSKANPALVYCSLCGFTNDGPDSARPASDPIVQAASGLMYLTGTAQSGPLQTGFPVTDHLTPLFATVGVLAALHHARSTGRGQRVDVSMFDSAVFSIMPREGAYLHKGEAAALQGNSNSRVVPANTYATSDGRFIMVFAHAEKFWRALVLALGDAELATNPKFTGNAARVTHRSEIDERIAAAFRAKTHDEWLRRLTEAGAIFAPVRTVPEVLDDPAVRSGMLTELAHPRAGLISVLNNPVHMSESPPAIRKPPPCLGEHTDEVLREWAMPRTTQ